jgi:Fe-S-cluster containining protein
MEKTDRKNIQHKIKITHSENLPEIPPMSNELKNRIISYLKKRKPDNAFTRIKQIYELVDAVIKEMEPMTVCRKGCAWCCAIPVEIMPIEIRYIEANTKLKTQFTGFIPIEGQEHNFGYCPLLDQHTATCTIYEHRPFNCRAFVVFDSPEYCKRGYEGEDISHWTNGGPENGYGNQGLLYLALDLVKTELGVHRSIERKDEKILRKRIKDIRCYFK